MICRRSFLRSLAFLPFVGKALLRRAEAETAKIPVVVKPIEGRINHFAKTLDYEVSIPASATPEEAAKIIARFQAQVRDHLFLFGTYRVVFDAAELDKGVKMMLRR